MKTVFMFITGITLAGQLALACKGGDEARLTSKGGKELALLNKTKKEMTLSEGVSLIFVSNCKVANPDQDLTAKKIDLKGYVAEGKGFCVGLSDGKADSKFEVTHRDLTSIARSGGCGGTITALK